jgi:hypothetical protein
MTTVHADDNIARLELGKSTDPVRPDWSVTRLVKRMTRYARKSARRPH